MAASESLQSDAGEDPRVRAAVAQLQDLLVAGETLETWAVQSVASSLCSIAGPSAV